MFSFFKLKEIYHYYLIGILVNIFSILLLNIIYTITKQLSLSILISQSIGMIVSWILNSIFNFKAGNYNLVKKKNKQILVVSFLQFLSNYILIFSFVNYVGLNITLSAVISAVLHSIFNFIYFKNLSKKLFQL